MWQGMHACWQPILFLLFWAYSLASPAVKFDFFTEFCDMLGVNDGLMKYDITKSGKVLHEMLPSMPSHNVYQVIELIQTKLDLMNSSA